jgi:glutamate/tyrosine decarboxylase-like PLP-dependent enzyme
MVAIVIARNEKYASIKNKGINGRKMVGYISDQGHYSTKKFVGVTGLGKEAIRLIPSDDKGKMDTKKLEETIKKDIKNGYIPFFIKATAGTTVL